MDRFAFGLNAFTRRIKKTRNLLSQKKAWCDSETLREKQLFTTLFFNNALAKYVLELGPEKYERKFAVENLSEVGRTTYQHSMENAKEYYKTSAEEKKERQQILADFDE